MSVNKVILVGRLGQDPEIRNTQGGMSVANFSLATNDRWTDKSGQRQDRTEWHRIVAWGKLATLCQQYLKKGKEIYLEGKLQTRQWQDKNGQTRYTTEIQANAIQFLGASGASAGAPSSSPSYNQAFEGGAPSPFSQPESEFSGEEPKFTEDDVPF